MKPTGNSFRDVVTGDSVRDWIDCYEVEWMAVNKWGFRVRKNKNLIELSKLSPVLNSDEVMNFLIAYGCDGILDDISINQGEIYQLEEIPNKWNSLKIKI